MSASFLNPVKIIKELPLIEGMTVADFGCGAGYFSLALAKSLKPSGRVIALDIWKPSLDALSLRSRIEGVFNIIETKQVDLEKEKGSGLPDKSCDLVIISNILFQSAKKDVIINEAKRVLRPGGFLLLIEWHPDKIPNKDFLLPLTKEETLKLSEKHNFLLEREISLPDTHYGFLVKKSSNL